MRRCTVVGAGVSGLTAAISLREAGWDAHVVAREGPDDTVSAVAAAVWTMTSAAPTERTRAWALASRGRFAVLAGDPTSGVVPLRQLEISADDSAGTWWERTPWVTPADPVDLPPGAAAGWWVEGFLVETTRYLPWLVARLADLGGSVTTAIVGGLDGLDEVVVNCSGLGARSLADDPDVRPIRGQVVLVDRVPTGAGFGDYSGEAPSYVYPRSADVVVGGTADVDDDDLTADPATRHRILHRADRLVEGVAGARVLGDRVGLRPGRHAVRVEEERLVSGTRVIHDYGHGGAGYILSWGCAEEVVRLAGGSGA